MQFTFKDKAGIFEDNPTGGFRISLADEGAQAWYSAGGVMALCASFASTPPHVSNVSPGIVDSISIDDISYIIDYMRTDGTKIHTS